MDIKARISVDGIPVGTISIVTLECGSGIHTYRFRFHKLFSWLRFPINLVHDAISALNFVTKELMEDIKHGNKIG